LTRYRLNNARFRIDSAITAQIQAVCRKTGASAFHFFLAAFKTLLLRHTGEEKGEICIGMADGGRNNDNVANSLGFFLTLLPLRFAAAPSQTFNEALKEARSKVLAALQNSVVPFDIILNETKTPRSTTHNPLFQAFINYRPGIQEKRQYCGCESEAMDYDSSQTAYDVSIDIIDNAGEGALVLVQGQNYLYSQSQVDIIAQSYHGLLKDFANFPASRLHRPALYDSKASQHAINIGRGPLRHSKWPEILVHRIDEVTTKFASSIALKIGSSTFTYRQMSQRINSIAVLLKSLPQGPGSKIGVFQEPSLDFCCSILAILRVGAVLVPLEPRLAPPRIALLVRDCALDVVMFDAANKKDVDIIGSDFKKIDISKLSTTVFTQVPNSARGSSTAIIMYTSGSTGTPKGILLRHSGWVNQTESASAAWKPALGSGVYLQSSSWSFDMSLSQTFLALCNGAILLGVPKEKHGDPLAIAKMIVSEQVTLTHATPWEYVNWINSANLAHLRTSHWEVAITAGEKPSHAQLQEFRRLEKQDLKLFNLYGPTEITFGLGSSDIKYHTINDLETPQVLFPNYSVYILDPKMRPLPVVVPGEIYVGGAGIAQGYLNHQNLTDDRFPLDDFAPPEYLERNWTKMHRSGDRGRLSPQGGLIVEGRMEGDTQIRLRGIRIDLRDIESTIIRRSNGVVRDAIVSLRTTGSTDAAFLVAYVVVSYTTANNSAVFLENLRLSLPLP
jgi:hybrid polyketide synthase/nonribosomal peptide synthetase ACE1